MESKHTVVTSTELHPWVKQTQACLEKRKPDDDGLIRPGKPKRLNVSVGKDSIPRAMLIWDQMLKAIDAGRFRKKLTAEPPYQTVVTVDGEDLSIALREKTTRREHKPTPEERARMRVSKFLHRVPAWDFIPTGKLVLTIDRLTERKRTINEVTWADTDRKRIEDRLALFCDVLHAVAREIKEGRARAEERQRIWAEEERRRREADRLQAQEERRLDELERQASAWRTARSIRVFALAVPEEAARRTGAVEPGSPLDRWIQWAMRHADTLDPVATVLAAVCPADQCK